MTQVDIVQQIKELTGKMTQLEKRTWKLNRRVTAIEIRVSEMESEVKNDRETDQDQG